MTARGPDYAARLERVRSALGEAGSDLMVVTPGADLRWLTGHAPPPLERLTCLVIPAVGEPTLLVPLLEQPEARACGAVAAGLVGVASWEETDDPYAAVAVLPGARSDLDLAVSDTTWARHVHGLVTALDPRRWRPAGPLLASLRQVKDAAEIAALREAGQAIDRVHARMGEWLLAGRTEREVGADIARAITAEGHATVNFVIVGSGQNGASPHATVTDRVLRPGDPVVVDIGGTMPSGYCSDCTRVYVVGGAAPDPDFEALYEVLHRAQRAGVDAVRPGARAGQVDAAARDVIAHAGYGEYFVHRTGHGIGLDEHEEPWIIDGNDTVLEAGMAFSVEPGIYLPDRFGARIEDIVAVTDTGVERLNVGPRGLTVR